MLLIKTEFNNREYLVNSNVNSLEDKNRFIKILQQTYKLEQSNHNYMLTVYMRTNINWD